MSTKTAALVLSLAGLTIASPRHASACGGPVCASELRLAPSSGSVPANLPGFWLGASQQGIVGAPTVTLTRVDQEESVAVDASGVLSSKLVAGATYRVRAVAKSGAERCEDVEIEGTFTASAEQPLPTSLGVPVVTDEDSGSMGIGPTSNCVDKITASWVDLEPSLGAAGAPWRQAIANVRAVVNGKPFFHSSERQPVEDSYGVNAKPRLATGGDVGVRVFVDCLQAPNSAMPAKLSPGRHTVKLVGDVAGIGELESSQIEVELKCPPDLPVVAQPDAGVGTAEEAPGSQATHDTAGSRPEDAGSRVGTDLNVSPVMGGDARAGSMRSEADDDSGCSLGMSSGRRSSPLSGLLGSALLLGLVVFAGRRRA